MFFVTMYNCTYLAINFCSVLFTVINPQKEFLLSQGLQQLPPVVKTFMVPRTTRARLDILKDKFFTLQQDTQV